MCDELPTREEMVAEILARPDLDPMIRQMFEQLNQSAMRGIERMAKLMIDPEPTPRFVKLTRKHGYTSGGQE
jgi:hypothetical protein